MLTFVPAPFGTTSAYCLHCIKPCALPEVALYTTLGWKKYHIHPNTTDPYFLQGKKIWSERLGEERDVVYFKIQSWHLSRDAEEKPVSTFGPNEI
jgi:hypothetical protein